MTQSFKDIINAKGKETEAELQPSIDAFKEAVESINASLEPVTDNTVQTEFGTFIYKALGNVNGSINIKKIESQEHAYYYSSTKPILGVVTGRRFGYSLRGKANNFYLDAKDLLPGLTGHHVELIKRDKQRVLARDFYAFKCAYYNRYKSLFNDFNNKTFDVSIPVNMASLYKVSATGDKPVNVLVLDGILKGEITSIRFNLPEAKWIDDKNVDVCNINSKTSLSYKYGLNTRDGVDIVIVGKVGGKEFKERIQIPMLSINKDLKWIDDWFEPDYYSAGLSIMNMNDIIKSEPIQALVREHINYNKGVAKTFEYLRLKYAKNLILNGMF